MRLLRYIGPGSEPNGGSAEMLIVEDAHNGERFGLFLDDPLRGALTSPPAAAPVASPAPPAFPPPAFATRIAPPTAAPSAHRAAPRAPSQPLTPREIQVRVRAGETPESLAAETGVSPDRIVRFAYAVLEERSRVGAEARRARTRRGGPEGEMLPFGEVVDARFEEHGISAQEISWDAIREGDGPWTVIARWRSGDLESSARWSFLLGARTVVPDDDTAMELLSDRPVQRHQGVPLTMVAVPEPETGDDDAGNLRRLPTRPDDQFFDQEAFNDGQAPPAPVAPTPSFGGLRAVPNQPPASATGAAPASPPAVAHQQPSAPPPPALGAFFDSGPSHSDPTLPLDLGDTGRLPFDLPGNQDPPRVLIESDDLIEGDDLPPRAAAGPVEDADAEDESSGRARIPSWDDILLGVRRKRD